MSQLQFCETVEVDRYEVKANGSVLVQSKAPFQPGEYIEVKGQNSKNDRIRICYDLYVSRMLQYKHVSGAATLAGVSPSVMIAVCTLIPRAISIHY